MNSAFIFRYAQICKKNHMLYKEVKEIVKNGLAYSILTLASTFLNYPISFDGRMLLSHHHDCCCCCWEQNSFAE